MSKKHSNLPVQKQLKWILSCVPRWAEKSAVREVFWPFRLGIEAEDLEYNLRCTRKLKFYSTCMYIRPLPNTGDLSSGISSTHLVGFWKCLREMSFVTHQSIILKHRLPNCQSKYRKHKKSIPHCDLPRRKVHCTVPKLKKPNYAPSFFQQKLFIDSTSSSRDQRGHEGPSQQTTLFQRNFLKGERKIFWCPNSTKICIWKSNFND